MSHYLISTLEKNRRCKLAEQGQSRVTRRQCSFGSRPSRWRSRNGVRDCRQQAAGNDLLSCQVSLIG